MQNYSYVKNTNIYIWLYEKKIEALEFALLEQHCQIIMAL